MGDALGCDPARRSRIRCGPVVLRRGASVVIALNDTAPIEAGFGSVRIRASVHARPVSVASGAADDEVSLLIALDRPPSIRGAVTEKGPSTALLASRAQAAMTPAAKCHLVLTFPAQVLNGIGIEAPFAHGIDTHSALFWPFLTFAWTCATTRDRQTGLSLYFMERLLQEMIVGVVVASLKARHDKPAADLHAAALSVITARVGDPDLTAASVAAELNTSLRTLQRQFTARGTTMDRSIRGARVRHAMTLLRDPAYSSLSIERVAHTCGLANGSSLARAFAAEGHPSPTRVRAARRPHAVRA